MVLLFLLLLAVPSYGEIAAATNCNALHKTCVNRLFGIGCHLLLVLGGKAALPQ